jgi:hypothetical protein
MAAQWTISLRSHFLSFGLGLCTGSVYVIVRPPTSLSYIERDPRSRTEIGERDTQLVRVNEATAV